MLEEFFSSTKKKSVFSLLLYPPVPPLHVVKQNLSYAHSEVNQATRGKRFCPSHLSKPREMVNQNLLKNNQLRVSEEREPFHIEFRNAPFIARASKRKKISPVILPTSSGHYSARLSGQVCQSNGGEGVAERIRSHKVGSEPISWENFLTSNDQFQVEVVGTRYLRCKSSQLTIPSPCDREASWWVAHPCGLTM